MSAAELQRPMTASNDIAERIARYAAQFGYDVERHGSASSSSQYIELAFYKEYDDGSHDYETLKIRVSDHDLPPTYGALSGYADYEVGPHDSGTEWDIVVADLAERTGNPLPPAVKAAQTRKAKLAAEWAAREAKMSEWQRQVKAESGLVTAEMVRQGLNDLNGKARKRARQKIRKQLGIYTGASKNR